METLMRVLVAIILTTSIGAWNAANASTEDELCGGTPEACPIEKDEVKIQNILQDTIEELRANGAVNRANAIEAISQIGGDN